MRLDSFLVQINKYKSRNKAAEAITRGDVFVNGKLCTKLSFPVTESDFIEIKETSVPFVSIGGDKLNRAISKLNPKIDNKVFIDVGASTGGFTDCLLRHNAKKVYCVDVGVNLLDESISSNPRVVVMDKTNARYLHSDDFEEQVDGIVVDCSFISLEYILPVITTLLSENGYILALIKPQFELKEKTKLKNGILKNDVERNKILRRLYDFSKEQGLIPKSMTCVTVDSKKNLEYIFFMAKSGYATPFDRIMIK